MYGEMKLYILSKKKTDATSTDDPFITHKLPLL